MKNKTAKFSGFSNECREFNTKVITLANHIKTDVKRGKTCAGRVFIRFGFTSDLLSQSCSVVMQNQ